MATLREISQNILNLYREGRSSNNEIISLRQINFMVMQYRALFLRREFNKNKAILDSFEQVICEDLIEVDKSKCPLLFINCQVLRTKNKLPKFMRGKTELLISFTGAVDGTTRFQLVKPFASNWQRFNKFSGNAIKVYLLDDYMYVIGDCNIKHLMIRGIFEDPTDLTSLGCFDDNTEYPFPTDMLPALTKEILTVELRILEIGENDTSNDTVQNK